MEDSESLSDLEIDGQPKLSFDELKVQTFKEPKLIKTNKEFLKALYFYCRDRKYFTHVNFLAKKNSKIIALLFWPQVAGLIMDKNNNQLSLLGLKIFNAMIQEEATNEELVKQHVHKINDPAYINQKIIEAKMASTQDEIAADKHLTERMREILKSYQTPARVLVKKILNTDSTLIMNEATKGLRNFSKNQDVIKQLMGDKDSILEILKKKFKEVDPLSQQYILEAISEVCKIEEHRNELVNNEDFIGCIMPQVKSISTKVTYYTLKIVRQLAKDEGNLEKLQGDKLRLSHKLIYAFRWLDSKNNQDPNMSQQFIHDKSKMVSCCQVIAQQAEIKDDQEGAQTSELDMVFREISKTFQYIFKFYDIHQKLLQNLQDTEEGFSESDIIETVISLGKATNDPKTTLNAATSLAHITEVLHCNEAVASQEAIEFMMDMLKDTKNIKHHRQGCRYFANLSFYSAHRNSLVQNKITAYLLGAIEADGHLDEDTIKHSAIALANLSSHKDFMAQNSKMSKGGDINQLSKVERGKIKPLIHLLDSANESKINLIQSACITLCNMASKPALHQHFVQEPEISTIKNCLQNPIDKNVGNELIRFMIKLVCNLTKNPEIVPQLSKKGFLEILFELLHPEREREIFGNVVTAISYMSVLKECQEKIIKNKIMARILAPITKIHEVDQKLIIIALTSMLFNGIEIQKEFIKNKGLETLMFFLGQKEKIFQQLSCKCFSLLSEHQDNLHDCISNVIVACLKNKDVDLETLKEITKIFINLILWRKLKKDSIETTCYLCDIGLMIKDLDMNILSIFCLNCLSENELSHQYIIKSCIDEGGTTDDIHQQSSIFSRINYLLELYEEYQRQEDKTPSESFKYELLVQLITSFYLNLSRNDENLEFLLNLKLFKKLNQLMQTQLSLQKATVFDNTALCYTNTIFGKLLKNPLARKQCIEEDGYKLFINILKNKNNEHLFIETLDSIKLFLTKREYLIKFYQIPQSMELSSSCHELNVSYLQVLAILSFEKENHKPLKEINFLEKLHDKKMFETIFKSFTLDKNKKNKKIQGNKKGLSKTEEYMQEIRDQFKKSDDKQSKKSTKNTGNSDQDKDLELTLAIAIMLANLSSEDDFIKSLLATNRWKKKDPLAIESTQSQRANLMIQQYDSENPLQKHEEIKQGEVENGSYLDQNSVNNSARQQLEDQMGDTSRMSQDPDLNQNLSPKQQYGIVQRNQFDDIYDEAQINLIPEIDRLKKLFNLLSHENQFVVEQIAILLANVSNSPYFMPSFIPEEVMKSLMKILKIDKKQKTSEVTLLAILIGVLNLSSLKDMVRGIDNEKFLYSLEEIIKNDQLPYVTKSIALLGVSNIYTLSKSAQVSSETKDFAFSILQNWKKLSEQNQNQPDSPQTKEEQQQIIQVSQNQSGEIVKNLVYSSLILFYNIILRKPSKEIIKKLINIITDTIISIEDTQIVNVVLELITLFTREKEADLLVFKNMHILEYCFEKLKSPQKDTLKMSALALSRLAAKLGEYNSEYFIINLKKFKEFDLVVENINKIQNNHEMDAILKYYLNFLENISSFKKTRDELDCPKLYDSAMQLYTDAICIENKVSLINIIFNLNFNLSEPRIISKEFLKLLFKTYKEQLKEDKKTQRKIIVLIVSASALEDNHKNIIKCGFYTQFKRNINELYEKLMETNDEVELFGLVNIALNKKYMHLIYQDLKKIYKIALKNQKIDFKTKVDLFSECSKFLAKLSQSSPEKGNNAANANEKDISEMIDHCLKALLFCLIQLIQLLDETQYPMFKYFLNAILESTKNLKNHLIILIKIDHLIDFLQQILIKEYEFQMKDFDDQVLNFSLRVIVCEIFFNLKYERNFFKRENITDSIKLLVGFAQKVLSMNIEKKMTIVSNTLRLLSQMIASIHGQPLAHEKVLKTNAVEFVKEAMALSKDLQPCINIDALFCLTNMMNIKELALDQSLLNQDIVNNALIIYFAYNHQVELDECIITFLYAISKYYEFQLLMKDKSKVLFFLMDKHLDASKGESYKESCRKKIFSTVHNMTENEDICKQLNFSKFIQLTNKMLNQTAQSLYSSDHIHELALKSLINMCRNTNESLEEANLKELFSGISLLYSKFKSLAKQYSLRLITILTKQWNSNKIEEYLSEIVEIISQFIERCDSIIEMKLALLNLERIALFKKLMIKLADGQSELLIKNISLFISKSLNKEDYYQSIEQLIKFCKKLSKYSKTHECLVKYNMHELCLEYISKFQSSKFEDYNEKKLREILSAIQNVMKLIKNIYEGGSIEESLKMDIFDKVCQKEEIIAMADNLLQSYKNNDELAIMIVNIIISFNSIQNKLDQSRVKDWICNFTVRLIESSKPEFPKQRQWFMEKYVFILELLVIKNADKIDAEVTTELLKIIDIDTTSFTKTIWFKIIKILSHLQFIQDITNQPQIEQIFKFIIQAYEKVNENLCFFFFIKIVIMIVKKVDNNSLFKGSSYYQVIFNNCVQFFKNNYKIKVDNLILEVLLCLIDFFKYLMNFQTLFPNLNNNEIVSLFIEMLGIHDNNHIVKALSSSLVEASKITVFYPDILNDQSLSIIFQKILNASNIEPKSLDNLSDALKTILNNTKVPIKYLISTTILRLTEPKTSWREKEESNIITLLKILQAVIKSLDDSKDNQGGNQPNQIQTDQDNQEIFAELWKKTMKYSLIAITNILIKSSSDYVFNRKVNLVQLLIDNSLFEQDSQLNLRFLYLLYISLDKNIGKDVQLTTVYSLFNFLLDNVHKFRSVLQMKESYVFEIPQYKIQAQQIQFPQNTNLPLAHSNSASTILSGQSKPREASGGQITVGVLDHQASQDLSRPSRTSAQGNQQDLMNVQFPGNASPVGSVGQNSVESFFFENEDFSIRKIDAIRLSLCMTIRVVYKLIATKKKVNCQYLLENELSVEYFKYFTPYIEYGDMTCIKQIIYLVRIMKTCSEFIQLHENLIRRDCVFYLFKVAERTIMDEASDVIGLDQDKNNYYQEKRRTLLVEILKTFTSMSSSTEFQMNLVKFNIMELMNKLKDREDPSLSDLVKDFFEKVVIHSNDQTILMAEQDFSSELSNIVQDNELRQMKVLSNIENLLIQKKIKLDKFSNNELTIMMKILGQRNYDTHASPEQIQIKKIILNVMNFIYVNKFLKEINPANIKYSEEHKEPTKTSLNTIGSSHNQPSSPTLRPDEERNCSLVSCVIEKQEMFSLLKAIVDNSSVYSDLNQNISELLSSYCHSKYFREDTLIQFVLPLFSQIVSNKVCLNIATANIILTCLIKLLKIHEISTLMFQQYDLGLLLNHIVQNQALNANDSVQQNLEIITKLMYYNPVRISHQSEIYIQTLLTHQQSQEFNRLGLFALYCISLCVQEQQFTQNLFLFEKDPIIKSMFTFIVYRGRKMDMKQGPNQMNSPTSNNQLNSKLKMVALQIVVNILEFVTYEYNNKNSEIFLFAKSIIIKFFQDFDILGTLINIAHQTEFSNEERKLVSRLFASIPKDIYAKINPLVELKQQGQEYLQFTIVNYFQSLNTIINSNDSESAYFGLYALLNFIINSPLSEQPIKSDSSQQLADIYSKIRLNQLDYQTMSVCMVKTELIQSILLLANKVEDEDITRICMKLLIVIMFKGTYNRILFYEEPKHSSSHSHVQQGFDHENFKMQLFDQLGVNLDLEKDKAREQLKSLLSKFQHFEISQIHSPGYVQFLHLLSQIIMANQHLYSSGSLMHQEERNKYLPPSKILCEVTKKLCIQITGDRDQIFKMLTCKGETKSKKVIMQKLFFFNYLLSVSIPDIVHTSLNQAFYGTSPQDDHALDQLERIFKTLHIILDLMKDKNLNQELDQVISGDQQPKFQHQDTNEERKEHEFGKEDDDEEECSVTISIIRLTLFNLECLLRTSVDSMATFQSYGNKVFKQQRKLTPDYFNLQESFFELMMTYLIDNEENGDVVETIYQICDTYLKSSGNNAQHENVKLMENSKTLMSMGIKHTAIYSSEQSYFFLVSLTTLSEKYRGKADIEKAMQQIMPLSLKNNQ